MALTTEIKVADLPHVKAVVQEVRDVLDGKHTDKHGKVDLWHLRQAYEELIKAGQHVTR